MRNPSLHERAVGVGVWLAIAAFGIGGSACNEHHNGVGLVTTAPPVRVIATLSPSLVGLTSLSGFDCAGFVFGTSFNVIVVSSGLNLTMDRVTLHLLDGTTLGGPSVTIPSPQLNARFGTTLVPAGTSRAFPMQPVFGCSVARPIALAATVLLIDQRGGQQTLNLTAAVR